MKKILLFVFAIGMVTMNMAAMSASKVRKNTRFLTDRMAYELKLSPEQYNDAYEINFDFINDVRYLMDDVVIGNAWALEDYYGLLDIRNDDMRWVLSRQQYNRFLGIEYFYRPIFASKGNWNFRVYIAYPNINFFYFGKPYHYRTYNGGHCRAHYNDRSYYRNRYQHDIYNGSHSMKDHDKYYRDDFGVTPRPGSSTRPSNRPSRPGSSDSSRPSGSSSSRPGSTTTNRPSGSSPSRPSTSGSSSESSTTRPSTTTRPSSGSSSSRPSTSGSSSSEKENKRKENKSSSSRSNNSNTEVSKRPSSNSSSSSSESRGNSNSSGSNRGGRR